MKIKLSHRLFFHKTICSITQGSLISIHTKYIYDVKVGSIAWKISVQIHISQIVMYGNTYVMCSKNALNRVYAVISMNYK